LILDWERSFSVSEKSIGAFFFISSQFLVHGKCIYFWAKEIAGGKMVSQKLLTSAFFPRRLQSIFLKSKEPFPCRIDRNNFRTKRERDGKGRPVWKLESLINFKLAAIVGWC